MAWDEDKHPRADDGKFGEGGGSSGSSGAGRTHKDYSAASKATADYFRADDERNERIRDFTEYGHLDMNAYLRDPTGYAKENGNKAALQQADAARQLREDMAKAPKFEGTVYYRGIRAEGSEAVVRKLLEEAQSGSMRAEAFWFASTDPGLASKVGAGIQIEIHAKSAVAIEDVSAIKGLKARGEAIIPHKTGFTVASITSKSGVTKLVLHETESESHEDSRGRRFSDAVNALMGTRPGRPLDARILAARLRMHIFAAMNFAAADGVERDASGAPSAFRIWRSGVNVTDHGAHVFTEQSARALMAEQSTRGNLISIDVDHLSLNEKSPPESRKAVGWMRLDTRHTAKGPELWATHVVWTDAVRAGLTKDPPEWRYFSPAYDVDQESGEIVSFLNLALTNNPATHNVTALSTRRIAASRNPMKIEDVIAGMYGTDEEKKAAREALASMSSEDREKCKAAMAAAMKDAFGEEEKPGGEGKDPPKEGADEKDGHHKDGHHADSHHKDTDTPADEKEKGEFKNSRARGEAGVVASLGDQDRRIKTLEEQNDANARERIFASRKDLTESQRKYLSKKPVGEIESILAELVPPSVTAANASAQPSVRPVQGQRSGAGVRAARLPADEHRALTQRFGRSDKRDPHWDGNEFVLPQISPTQARAILARHAKDYGTEIAVPMRANRSDGELGTIGNFNMREFDHSMADTLKKAQVRP
jgi:Mu-like prophage I protein/NAD:arginine ADP-ribosyltransferase